MSPAKVGGAVWRFVVGCVLFVGAVLVVGALVVLAVAALAALVV